MATPRKVEAGRSNRTEKLDHAPERGRESRTEKRGMRAVETERRVKEALREKSSSPEGERAASQRKRAEIAENIVMKKVPEGSIGRRDDTASMRYMEKKEFDREFRERDPGARQAEIDRTLGFRDPRDNKAFVKEGSDTLSTAVHEKLHQKSNCDLPTNFKEGITEHLARREAGAMGDLKQIDARGREIPRPTVYEKETMMVLKVSAVVGDKPIEQAYFERRTDLLKQQYESAMGKGSFDRLLRAFQ
jgi:hypothetical protein